MSLTKFAMNETENHFLEHLSSELSLASREEAIPLVSSVMMALRQTLSRQNAETLLVKLPEFLKRHFPVNWKEEKQIRVEHLDELVTLIMERDKANPKTLFKSELQTLSVILFTLKKLFSVVDPKMAGIGQLFCQEVKEASMEISV
jgi:uncharacterized protein (DUF2267 family)